MDKQIDDLWPLLERSFEGVLLVSANRRRVLRANSVAAEWLQQAAGDLIGRSVDELFVPSSRDDVFRGLQQALASETGSGRLLVAILPADGRERLAGFEACRVSEGDADLLGVLLHPTRVPLAFFARLDPLTHLPDRGFLEFRLAELLQRGVTAKTRFALLFVDIDNFKVVNDKYGHLVGDQVLSDVALRLQRCKQNLKDEHITRYGGDEFAVLIENLSASARVEEFMNALQTEFEKPFEVPGGEVKLSLSMGLAIGPGSFQSSNDVIAEADRAMYAAKRAKQGHADGGSAGEPGR